MLCELCREEFVVSRWSVLGRLTSEPLEDVRPSSPMDGAIFLLGPVSLLFAFDHEFPLLTVVALFTDGCLSSLRYNGSVESVVPLRPVSGRSEGDLFGEGPNIF